MADQAGGGYQWQSRHYRDSVQTRKPDGAAGTWQLELLHGQVQVQAGGAGGELGLGVFGSGLGSVDSEPGGSGQVSGDQLYLFCTVAGGLEAGQMKLQDRQVGELGLHGGVQVLQRQGDTVYLVLGRAAEEQRSDSAGLGRTQGTGTCGGACSRWRPGWTTW